MKTEMKLYLICEDVDLGCHVIAVFDTPEQAEAEYAAIVDAWAKYYYAMIGIEVPENVHEMSPQPHNFWIDEHTLNDTDSTHTEVLRYDEYYLRYKKCTE